MEKSIYYDNRTFTIGTAGRYYFAHKQGKMISLHRYKYEKEIGAIPMGWHIHHKDGNFLNNDIENLCVIEPHAHRKLHPTSEATLKKWHEAGIKAAPIWHGSEEGIAWHNQHYENVKAKLHERIERDCCNCGKKIKTFLKNINCFCSNNCKCAWRRKNKPDFKLVNCLTCGKEFQTLKYLPNMYCSKECRYLKIK